MHLREIHPSYFLAAVNVTNGFDYLLQKDSRSRFFRKLRFKQLREGPEVSAPRERTGASSPSSGEVKVPSMVLDLTNDPTTRDVVTEALEEDDPTRVEPTSRLTFCGL